ncbi:MAG TPA: hypothetical protein VGR93_08345 [Candidatus Acidoferrales bacterium]|nr:hypothetical protein [Candidatus Acidoferrales bacterium]
MGAPFIRGFFIAGLLFATPVQNARVLRDIAKEKAKYENADSPVKRAKSVPKLGREEYIAARQALRDGDQNAALQYLRDYNEQASAAHDELEKSVADPEKHSNGFRQLQISVRERARELKDITSRVAFDQRKPFEELQKALDALNQKLILELFPNQPNHKKQPDQKNP